MKAIFKSALGLGVVLALGGFVAIDWVAAWNAEAKIQHQVRHALGYEARIGNSALSTRAGTLTLEAVNLSRRTEKASVEMPFKAERISMDVSIYDWLSREFSIRRLDLYDAELTIHYYGDGLTNLQQAQQHLAQYIAARRAEHMPAIVWDVSTANIHRLHLTVVNAQNLKLADVTIPTVTIKGLGSDQTGTQNASRVLVAVQKAIIMEVLKGNAQGHYDLSQLKDLVGQELKANATRILKSEAVQQLLRKGVELIKQEPEVEAL